MPAYLGPAHLLGNFRWHCRQAPPQHSNTPSGGLGETSGSAGLAARHGCRAAAGQQLLQRRRQEPAEVAQVAAVPHQRATRTFQDLLGLHAQECQACLGQLVKDI